MNIVEATEKALQSGRRIYRTANPNLMVAPAKKSGLACPIFGDTQGRKYWTPTKDDLLAEDWKLGE